MESATTMLSILLFILTVVFSTGATAAQYSTTTDPIMLSTPSFLKVMEGDTVILPCNVLNLGRNVRVWKQLPSNILFSGTIAVSRDHRVSLVNDSLQIEKITTAYAGDYVCQISKHPNLNVLHKIFVNVPPSVSPDPPEGKIIFRRGDSATIFCNPSGEPKPHIVWTYGIESLQGTALPPGVRQVHGSQLHFPSVDIHHAGVYQCTAENDVGKPANATFILNVHYAPELLVKPDWAHGDEGASVDFLCTCRSYPTCQLTWLRGDHKQGQKLENDRRIRLKYRQTSSSTYEYTLKIQKLKREDLGQYTCAAKNSVGHTYKTVEISGLAEPIKLRGNESGEGSFLLKWTVKSHSPIIEYQLKIRKHKSNDHWTDVVIPASIQEGQSLFYSQSYNVTGLESNAKYEVVLQAHNDFGWNRPSETFLFGEDPSTTEPEIEEGQEEREEEPETAPSLLPLYEAELDVTDPTYLMQNSVSKNFNSVYVFMVFVSTILFFHLPLSLS